MTGYRFCDENNRTCRKVCPIQTVDEVCFLLTFRKTPGEGFPHFDRFDGQNFTFPALSEGTGISTSAEVDQGSAFGNRKPLKRLDLNFNMDFAISLIGHTESMPDFSFVRLFCWK